LRNQEDFFLKLMNLVAIVIICGMNAIVNG